ncbi:MAG: PaaI family thioesterase [Caldilineaceae bacterium SB0668_bin_21]|nr:PaaI family thioesterase [Caldilineaceae bacterium SB0668_bin_21]MYC23731.1 PaaI family thioesterase [Caldilineaceae bacterium SB0662_bin_25]
MQKQPNSAFCFVCGMDNVAGVKVRFYETVSAAGAPELFDRFSGRHCHQGYPGRVHGGVLTGILDETIARAVNYGAGVDVERWGITAELSTRFLHPVPHETEVSARGRVLTQNRRMFTGSGEILLPDGTVAVRAEGKFLKLPLNAISGSEVALPGWRLYGDKE